MKFQYTLANEIFKTYGFYAVLMALKMFAVVFLTGYYRFTKKVFSNPEDTVIKGGSKVGTSEEIERANRAHLNDIENLIPFWIIGMLYVSTDPTLSTAIFCYRTFAVTRIVHSLAYVFANPQPCRALAFFGGMLINIFMAVQVLRAFS